MTFLEVATCAKQHLKLIIDIFEKMFFQKNSMISLLDDGSRLSIFSDTSLIF